MDELQEVVDMLSNGIGQLENIRIEMAMHGYLQRVAEKHKIPIEYCMVTIVDANIQVQKYIDHKDEWEIIENKPI